MSGSEVYEKMHENDNVPARSFGESFGGEVFGGADLRGETFRGEA